MKIKKINLLNFRNYSNISISFHDKLTILVGNNAQGKTNIVEGISILALTKSFRVGNNLFSCYIRSINKKRRPERIFIEFAEYYKIRPTFYKDGEFMVNDKLVWKKLKEQS